MLLQLYRNFVPLNSVPCKMKSDILNQLLPWKHTKSHPLKCFFPRR